MVFRDLFIFWLISTVFFLCLNSLPWHLWYRDSQSLCLYEIGGFEWLLKVSSKSFINVPKLSCFSPVA